MGQTWFRSGGEVWLEIRDAVFPVRRWGFMVKFNGELFPKTIDSGKLWKICLGRDFRATNPSCRV